VRDGLPAYAERGRGQGGGKRNASAHATRTVIGPSICLVPFHTVTNTSVGRAVRKTTVDFVRETLRVL
jgi:hypothetical protein